jgi:hypothetical protein
MKFETAFAKAWGRDPTPLEIERVRRVCDAFEVRDNDALLSIAGLLQFYDGNYRQFGGHFLKALDARFASADARLGPSIEARVLQAVDVRLALAEGRLSTALSGAEQRLVAAAIRRERQLPRVDWVVLGACFLVYSILLAAVGLVAGALLAAYPSANFTIVLAAPVSWVLPVPLLAIAIGLAYRRRNVGASLFRESPPY